MVYFLFCGGLECMTNSQKVPAASPQQTATHTAFLCHCAATSECEGHSLALARSALPLV